MAASQKNPTEMKNVAWSGLTQAVDLRPNDARSPSAFTTT
jgi:hypothetical protein